MAMPNPRAMNPANVMSLNNLRSMTLKRALPAASSMVAPWICAW
jgi:hypothetical protein